MPLPILVILALIGVAFILYLIDRLLLWMEHKGWISWRNMEPRLKGGLRGAMSSLQEIVEPQIRQVNEEQEQRKADSDSSRARPPASGSAE